MAKKKHKKKSEAAHGGGPVALKLPKTIGGVKLPKKLRERTEALVAQATGPAGREIAAAGLALAASALRSSVREGQAAAKATAGEGAKPAESLAPASGAAKPAGAAPAGELGRMIEAVAGAAGAAFLEAMKKR